MAHILKVDGSKVKLTATKITDSLIAEKINANEIVVVPIIATDRETGKYFNLKLAYNLDADEKGNKLKINPFSETLTQTPIGGDMILMHDSEYCAV